MTKSFDFARLISGGDGMEKSKLRNILDLIVKPYKAEMIILAVLWGVFFVLNVFFGDIEPQYAAAIAILIGTVFVFFGIQAMFRRSEKTIGFL